MEAAASYALQLKLEFATLGRAAHFGENDPSEKG